MSNEVQSNGKNYVATLLLSWFLGWLGVHRFYTGYIGIGVFQLLTFGGFGFWMLIDFVSICLGNYKDSKGQPLKEYSPALGRGVLVLVIVLTILQTVLRVYLSSAGK